MPRDMWSRVVAAADLLDAVLFVGQVEEAGGQHLFQSSGVR